jgi:hypothetical protein
LLQEFDRRFPLFSREEVLGAGMCTGGRRSAVDEYEVGELLRWDARRPAFDTLSLQPGTAPASYEDSLSVRSLDAHLQVNNYWISGLEI